MAKFDWYNETSKEFLDRGYLNNKTIYDRIDAIADTVYHVFNDTEIKDKVKEYIELGYYVLPSPVWANVGTKKAAGISCFNSYIEDSIKSILHTAAEVGMLCKIGGGTSAYFGSIRPAGSPISVGGTTYGPVHFMKIFDVIKNTISQGSCYIEGTQVLTNNGFKDFRDVDKNIDLLAQVDQYNNTTFTNQYELVVNDYTGELYCLSGKKRHNLLNLKVTPNHRMVVEKCKGDKRFKNKRWAGYTEIVTAEELKLHRDNRIPINTNIIGNKHLSFEDMLRIAYQADGRKNKPSHKLSFHFSKQRKIQRLTWILDNLKLDYTSYITKQGTTRIDVENALKFKIKNFSEWIDLSKIDSQWGSEFINELSYWDGSKKPKCILYSSCDYSNIEYAQAIASISNYKTSLSTRKKVGKQDLYRLIFSDVRSTNGESLSISKEQYDGKVYCAIVPNGRLIVKYNDTVSVCGNTRRGEFAAYLDISHGDIEDFIRINQEGHPLQRFPFGVCVSDDWLESMKNGDAQKRKIWASVLEARCKTGFPYIMFSDTVNNNTVDVYKDKNMRIYSSNMCSEILLPTNAEETFVCDLIGMNLTKYDEWKNTDAVRIATYIADAVLEEFIEMYENEDLIKRSVNFAKRHRALGIGASGYHSLLQSKMIPFESMEAKFLNLEIFKHIQDNAWEASKELAQRYGAPELLRDYGRRNTTLTAVAPNTSSSMIMGQHSQSIEPYTANYYIKKSAKKKLSVKNPYLEKVLDEKNKNTLEIWESILIKGGSVQHLDFLSEQEKKIFRTFGEISQKEILIQAAQRQKYVDQGQSLNLMIHPNTPIKDINKLMLEAHGMGIKTLYYQLSTNAAQEFIRDILSCDNCAG
jgi:ribonucleoside-diphosphate reductase alpha chain